MEKRNVDDVLYKTAVVDLYRVPVDAKMWYVEHIYGDYEMPLYFYIDSTNMLVGTNRDFNRFYVGKVGEKKQLGDGSVVAPISLWFMDHHVGKDYLGHDKCHQKGVQTYFGNINFYGDKACIWGAHGNDISFVTTMLPESNGNLYQEIVSVEDDYLEASLKAYVYSNFTTSAFVEPKILPLVEMIRDLTLQSSDACFAGEFKSVCEDYEKKYDLSPAIYQKKKGEVSRFYGENVQI